MAFYKSSQICRLLKSVRYARNCRYCSSHSEKKGLVLGVFKEENDADIVLTSAAESYNKKTCGKLIEAINLASDAIKKEKSLVFWGLDDEYRSVAVVGVGGQVLQNDELEEMDENKEAVRIAANEGCRALKSYGMTSIYVDDMGDPESAAEGAVLGTWCFNACKTTKKEPPPTICAYEPSNEENWETGVVKANAQNLARLLMDTPANLMTPTIFAERAQELLSEKNVDVKIHDRCWAEEMGMGGFLSVTRGSDEEPKFLEMIYCGRDDCDPIVLVGKGVTFDSGGISLKPSANMDAMRADMGGASCVVATLHAVASLGLPVNVVGLVPLCENMPSGKATKPGDVITMMNGKTVCVDNTDAEGRLILADALTHSKSFNPHFVLDIATLTGAMAVALGNAATGVFTNSNELWDELRRAGCVTGDRVWRFPLWKCYSKNVNEYEAYDINNIGKGKGGGSCTAAAFLREFVPENTKWMHLDMAGVMGPTDSTKYLQKGMTGRPTRTLVQFIQQLCD